MTNQRQPGTNPAVSLRIDGVDLSISKRIPLVFPIMDAGRELTELTMRRAKVSDHRYAAQVAGVGKDYEHLLFANLCEISEQAIDDMDFIDYAEMQRVYASFLNAVPKPKAETKPEVPKTPALPESTEAQQ